MVPQASKDDPAARVAPEESLTINRRQSWFGSFRSVLHRSALSAKATVESLRGNHSNTTPLAELDSSRASPDVPSTGSTTPKKHTSQDGSPTRKSAMASLRQNLSRHSRNSERGSVSNVFRRNGSNVSSPRAPRDPEAIARQSQDLSNTASPLSKNGNTSKDPAVWVPLPSSPINIPPPPPTLWLDLGPPAMLSPFKPTESDLADMKALQDPENITTGIPSDCPLDWHSPGQLRRSMGVTGGQLPSSKEVELPDQQHQPVPTPAAMDERNDVFGPRLPAATPNNQFSLTNESVNQKLPSHLTAEDYRDIVRLMGQSRLPVSEIASESAYCSRPQGLSSPVTMLNGIRSVAKGKSSECTGMTTLPTAGVPHATPYGTVTLEGNAPDEIYPIPDGSNDSLDAMDLPSPQAPIKGKAAERRVGASGVWKLVKKFIAEHGASIDLDRVHAQNKYCDNLTKLDVISAQEKYRDSLAELEGCIAFEELDPGVVQYVEQNPFVGGPGTPGNALHRSDSVKTISCSAQSDRDFAMPQIQDKATEVVANHELDPAHGFADSQILTKARQDRLFNDTDQNIVYENGPPSPERSVKLPLRPEATMTKHTSFDSTVFMPILDRVAANNLHILRPDSDPVLRQKYFPHAAVAENDSVSRQREPSLDSDEAASGNNGSSAAVGVFERAVEKPSPLHIRKQSDTRTIDTDLSTEEHVSPSTASALDSSPARTPSMGDRQQFDRQRAERNARYSAIFSGDHGTMMDLDAALKLAEFGNGGPIFKSSTPKRGGDGKQRDSCKSPISESASPLEENKSSSMVSKY